MQEGLPEQILAEAYLEHLREGGLDSPEVFLVAHGEASEEALELLQIAAHLREEQPYGPRVGQRIGPYRLVSELGSGGMGTVYLAEVEEVTGSLAVTTRVALKVIHPHLLSRPGFFKRFLREAEVGKRVRHENVVSALDVDATEVETGVAHFLAMEYVEGRTLRELLQTTGPTSEGLLREIARQVASGLAAIHEAGIVHRDLKPENILFTDDHRVRIMDLGVARLVDQTAALTKEGQFAGTVLYAAPEQFGAGAVGPPADLYALGVVLYELASGENPFRRDEAAGVVRAHLDEIPVRLNHRDADLSAFFSGIVTTLLAKDPAERFASASELSAALEEGERSSWWGEQEETLRRLEGHLPRVPVRRETRLHGREGDIAVLRDAWQHAGDGRGKTLLLHGEAGIGKTRLVDAFVTDLGAENAHVLYGSYPPSGGQGGITDAIVEHFGSADLEESLRPYLTVTPSLVAPLAALLKHERLPEDAASPEGDALHAVMVHLMRGLAAEKPLLWVVDDLHFASTNSRRVVLSLARAVEGHPVLLLLTTRPGVPEEELSHFSRLENFRRLELGRLSAREVIELLRDVLRSEALADKLGAKIAYKSDGVPFFVFEMIRGLRDGQFIEQLPDGSYIESKVIEDIEVPSAIRDLIEARLQDLTREERGILDVAAVQGFEFEPDLIACVRDRKRIEILEALGDLQRRHGVVRWAGDTFRFDHHQFQEVLYEDLSGPLGEEYHAAIAEALEDREAAADRDPRDIDGALCVQLCEHFLRGARGERAVRYLDASLIHLETVFLNDQAIILANRALEIDGLLGSEARSDVLLRKNGCLDLLGRHAEQKAVLTEARALAEEAGDSAASVKVERAIGKLKVGGGHFAQAKEHLERALALAREIGDRQGETRSTGDLGKVFYSIGHTTEATAHFQRALAIASEIGDRRGEAHVTANLGTVFGSLSRIEEARAHFERALAIAREIGDRRLEAMSTMNLAMGVLGLGHYEEAMEHLERALVIAREIGDRRTEAMSTGNLGLVLISLGCCEQAKEHYESHLALARERGDRVSEGYALSGLGRVADEKGEETQALALAGQALALRRAIGHGAAVTASLIELGERYLRIGDVGAARKTLQECVDLSREQHKKPVAAWALALLACMPEGDADAAVAALDDAGENGSTTFGRYYLWKATRDFAHLIEARRFLDHLVEHAPEEYRETMLNNVRLNREIMEAWAEHGGGEQEETQDSA